MTSRYSWLCFDCCYNPNRHMYRAERDFYALSHDDGNRPLTAGHACHDRKLAGAFNTGFGTSVEVRFDNSSSNVIWLLKLYDVHLAVCWMSARIEQEWEELCHVLRHLRYGRPVEYGFSYAMR